MGVLAVSGLIRAGSGMGCPYHLCCIRQRVLSKLLKSRLFLGQATFNKMTLVICQIGCQDPLIFQNVCSVNELRNFRIRHHWSPPHHLPPRLAFVSYK